jgi:hypothetical protein
MGYSHNNSKLLISNVLCIFAGGCRNVLVVVDTTAAMKPKEEQVVVSAHNHNEPENGPRTEFLTSSSTPPKLVKTSISVPGEVKVPPPDLVTAVSNPQSEPIPKEKEAADAEPL